MTLLIEKKQKHNRWTNKSIFGEETSVVNKIEEEEEEGKYEVQNILRGSRFIAWGALGVGVLLVRAQFLSASSPKTFFFNFD